MQPRVGSLFSGYGGLTEAVEQVTGGRTVWVSDIDPGACKILAHNYPNTPNLGDITAINWDDVEDVEVIDGGFPCQDLSLAGARAGMRDGTRSGLWSVMCQAIAHKRPRLVVIENVRGLLSAEADSDVEPCPWCMGDIGSEPVLRALGAVLADLAGLGYDAAWHGLRAADVGAPHGRFRIFIVAWPARTGDADAGGRDRVPTDPDGAGPQGAQPAPGRHLSNGGVDADPEGVGWLQGWPESTGVVGGSDAALGGDGFVADAYGDGFGGVGREFGGQRDVDGCHGQDGDGDQAEPEATADTRGGGRERRAGVDGSRGDAGERGETGGDVGDGVVSWGEFEPAIRRWEQLTRPAPAPTEAGSKGGQRLSPRFVEWMMGLPGGWVTGVPGLTRNEQLKALGNGVVPQQAAAAVEFLFGAVGNPLIVPEFAR